MKSSDEIPLPNGYKKIMELNLQNNPKLKLGITITALILSIIMGIYGNQIRPIKFYLRENFDQAAYIFLGILLYMIMHELIHCIFMWILGGKRARLAFHGPFTFASSTIYFHKWQYMIIALAPFVIWGTVLGFLCHIFVKTNWFWTFYLIQIVNITGAVSDLYLVKKFIRKPSSLLIRDNGAAISAFVKL